MEFAHSRMLRWSTLPIFVWLACSLAKPLPFPLPYPETSFSFLQKTILDYDKDAQMLLTEDFQDPEASPGLWEGDIAGFTIDSYSQWRLGLRWDVFANRRWINNTVPYHISHKYSSRVVTVLRMPSCNLWFHLGTVEREIIQSAIYTLNLLTCIDFVPYDGEAKDYLLIWPVEEPAGCWSFIGRLGGQQILSLQQPDRFGPKCLGGPGKPIHEMLHALGVFHEQSRADRDDHVFFIPENVIRPFLHNFDKQSLENTTYDHEYDYKSIMHYGMNFFSAGKDRPTLIPKQRGARIGQRDGLSRTDCFKINKLYGCFDKSPYEKIKYESLCDIMGL